MARSQMETFGVEKPYHCGSRAVFTKTRHPGAANCACPKFDDGLSCVPVSMWPAWFAYIGLKAEATS